MALSASSLSVVYDTVSGDPQLIAISTFTGFAPGGAPSAHASTHITGGSDIIPVYATTSTGMVPLSEGSTAQFLKGDGTWATPTAADPWTYVKVSTGHVATSNTAFFDITSLQFTPGTNSTYEFEVVLLMKTSTTTANPRFQYRWPTACSSVGWMNVAQTFNTQLMSFGNDTSTQNSAVGGLGTTTAAWPMIGGGVIRTFGGTASSFGVMHASETAGVYISTMVGSFLKYRTY